MFLYINKKTVVFDAIYIFYVLRNTSRWQILNLVLLLGCEEFLSPDSSLEDASGNFYTSMLVLQVCEYPVNAFQGRVPKYCMVLSMQLSLRKCLPCRCVCLWRANQRNVFNSCIEYDSVLVKILHICISYLPNWHTYKNSVGENDIWGSWMRHFSSCW